MNPFAQFVIQMTNDLLMIICVHSKVNFTSHCLPIFVLI